MSTYDFQKNALFLTFQRNLTFPVKTPLFGKLKKTNHWLSVCSKEKACSKERACSKEKASSKESTKQEETIKKETCEEESIQGERQEEEKEVKYRLSDFTFC